MSPSEGLSGLLMPSPFLQTWSKFSLIVRSWLASSAGLAFLAGLLARLALMPFAAHSDLLDIYWRASLIAFHHERMISLETLLRYFHAGYLRLIASLLPPVDTLWIHPDSVRYLDFSYSGWTGPTSSVILRYIAPSFYSRLPICFLIWPVHSFYTAWVRLESSPP